MRTHSLTTSNTSLLRSRLSCSITTPYPWTASFSYHCSLMSFVRSSWRHSVVSDTVRSVSSPVFFWGFFHVLPPWPAEVISDFFLSWFECTLPAYRLDFSQDRSAKDAVCGCCLGGFGYHPSASFSLICTRQASSDQRVDISNMFLLLLMLPGYPWSP